MIETEVVKKTKIKIKIEIETEIGIGTGTGTEIKKEIAIVVEIKVVNGIEVKIATEGIAIVTKRKNLRKLKRKLAMT